MKSISVIINERSKRSIELKDEYRLDEFINFFEKEIRLVKGYRLDSPMSIASEKGAHPTAINANAAEVTEADC